MHAHDGCGCGHAHATEATSQEQPAMEMAGGCGEGCGCGNQGAGLAQVEVAALRGFLSGVYASRLDRAELEEYLAQMAAQDGSEFQQPALFLAEQLSQVPAKDEGPAAWGLLDAIADEEE